MDPSLTPHYNPVISHLQPLAPLVIVAVVKGLDIKQYGESIVFPSLGAFLDSSKPVVPVSVGAGWNGAGMRGGELCAVCYGGHYVCLCVYNGMINVDPV